MRTTGAGVAACCPGCLAEHGRFHTGAGLGHGAGPAAGRGCWAALRLVPHPPGASAPASVGQRAGPSFLAVRYCGAVPLVTGGVGRAHPPVRGSGAAGGRNSLLPTVQLHFAEFGLSCRRCSHSIVPFGTFAHLWGYFPAEKNETFCKKPLSLWTQMV